MFAAEVERLIGSGGNRGYGEAVQLVARMGTLRPPAEHAAYVAALRTRHARKRTFMALL